MGALVKKLRWICVGGGCLGLLSSCLVSPPPDLNEETPTRPNLNLPLAVPPVNQVLIVDATDVSIPFSIPFSSEMAGEQMRAQLWLNYGFEKQRFLLQRALDATSPPRSGMEGQEEPGEEAGNPGERELTFYWNVSESRLPKGCQQLSLLMTHASNFDSSFDEQPGLPIDNSKVALATWWLNVGPELDEQQNLLNCPLVVQGVTGD